MSIKTTYTLNRSVAESIIKEKVKSGYLTDRQLCDILECFPESEYRNYFITELALMEIANVIENIEDFNYKV